MPVYLCVGNHDHLLFEFIVDPWLDLFNDFTATPTDNIHLISMDSGGHEDYIDGWVWIPGMTFPIPILDWIPEGTGLTADQGYWLSNKLDDYPDYHNILFMHHPVVCDVEDDNYPAYGEGAWNNGCIYRNRDPLMHMLRDTGVELVLGGHTHLGDQYVVDEVGDENRPRVLSEDPSDGYNDVLEYWEASVPPNPIYVTTGACGQFLDYRKIQIVNDELRVYKTKGFPDHPSLDEYSMDLIPFPWVGRSDLDAAGRLHLFNSTDSHTGVIGGIGGEVESQIEGVYYEDEPIENETTGELMNWTAGELINVMVDENELYNFTIDIFLDSVMNLEGTFVGEDNGGRFFTHYKLSLIHI